MLKRISPLRYPGGKGKMYDKIKNIIVNNNLKDCTYIEPFAGGSEVALQLLKNKIVKKIIINDFDIAIYAFWYSVLNYSKEFIEKIKKTEITLDERKKQIEVYNKKNKNCLFDLGFATFFLNRVNRSGIIKGGPISSKEDTKYTLDCRFNKENLIKRIESIVEMKENIDVENLEANILLEKVKETKEKTFIFLDPPYYVKGNQLYMNYFLHEDHLNLRNKIKELENINYIITYDDVPQIIEMYKGFDSIHYNLSYTLETKSSGKEVMFYNSKVLRIS